MSSEFDRRLDDWFDAVEPRDVPSDVLPRALVEARATGQMRAPWHRLTATLESAWTSRSTLAPGLVLAATALILAVALAGAAVASGLVRLPSPPPVVDGLIAVQDRFDAVQDGQWPAYVIRFIDPQTGEDVFTTPPDVRACAAHISPDGSQYAFLQQIPEVSPAGEVDVAVAPVAPDYRPTLLLHKPYQQWFDASWAPDGSALAMTVEAESLDAGYRELWVVPVDGTPARRLTDIQASYSADWSSSGDWIAFVGVGRGHPLYLIRPDGTDLRTLRPSGVGAVAWSPLRDELAYTATDGRLHVVGVDGQERLATADLRDPALPDQSAGMPVWSPDATRIAIVLPDGALEIFDVAASTVSAITTGMPVSRQDWALDGRPVWSADGRSLIAVTGDGELWKVAVDGSQQRLIADHVQDRCMSASYALSWQQLAR